MGEQINKVHRPPRGVARRELERAVDVERERRAVGDGGELVPVARAERQRCRRERVRRAPRLHTIAQLSGTSRPDRTRRGRMVKIYHAYLRTPSKCGKFS